MHLSKPQKLICDMEKFVGGSISVICGSMLLSGNVDIWEFEQTINELYRLNDALRIRIVESSSEVVQTISEYFPKEIDVLYFDDKSTLDAYAEQYAKEPLDYHGELCEFKIVVLPGRYGILVKLHHIVGDAWTLSLIGNQLNALLRGETPDAYSYADFLESENAYLRSKRYEKDKAFFLEQFRKCDEATYLSEKPSNGYTASRKTFVFERAKASAITDYSRDKHVSVFTLFTAALSVYMNRVKMNVEKFYIGTAVLNRGSNKEKNTMGMFINTVPMLMELDNQKSFAENLSEIEGSTLSALRHQKYNYSDVLADVRKEYGFSEKLYDVIISYQNATVIGDNIETTWYHSGCQTESLQIHIDDRENAGVFRIHYDYLIDKMTEHDIEMLHAHLSNLLFSAIDNDRRKIYELALLTKEEKQKLLFNFNDTAANYPHAKCVHKLFEEQASRTPDRVAVIDCDRTITYRELNNEANQIAHGLIKKGISVGDIVAFILPRNHYLIAAMLGILKAGAAYLPIDPDYPKDRIDFMLSDSRSKHCISQENISELLNHQPVSDPMLEFSNKTSCYCIYTSGSTGKPKGVCISHRNVVNFIYKHKNNEFQSALIANCDAILFVNSIVFDISLQETFLPLVNGIRVIIVSDMETAGIESAIRKNCDHRLGLIITPTKLSIYMRSTDFCFALKHIRLIMCGAESFSAQLFWRIRKNTSALVFNGYGPTETTCGASYARVDLKADITIGKPIANTQFYIANKYMQIVPIGVTGELCIAGDGVGAGYLNRPELTAEKFIDNPFGKGKLYKTGDLAYWREDGNIVYVGRNDFQVKIRGLRIELGEIENAISSLDGITQAVVIVRKDDHDRQIICAFYTGNELDAKSIRSLIGRKLPKYMLPHIITHISELPLTPSGKVNRKALPDVDLNRIENATEYVTPVTGREKAIAKILADILEVERIGLEDDFFDLGCDSLKAIEFIAACHYEGIYFNLQSVFDHPTISSLLKSVDSADHNLTQYDSSDFEKIDRLISGNREDHISVSTETPVGNLLLAGATGFLGAHILADYLAHDTGTAYCIIRGKDADESKQRLAEILSFYFRDTYTNNNRIVVLCGDLTKERFGLSEEDYRNLFTTVDTVINSVASVKHYGSYEFFYEANVKSAVRLIDFCKASNAKLIHISTTSIAGNDFDNQMAFNVDADETLFTEHDFYIGQPLDNVYVRSKFEAEKAVLEAMVEGMQANIMRMGNLTNRRIDGRFQKNYESNAFARRFKAIVELGCAPEYLLGLSLDFTPIDDAANAVMTITRHFRNGKNVFHVENTNLISFSEIFNYMRILGINMKIVSGDEFGEMLRQAENDLATKHIYETFINDIGQDNRLQYDSPIKIDASFSDAYLRSLGFVWQKTDLAYLQKYFGYFKEIGYIEGVV